MIQVLELRLKEFTKDSLQYNAIKTQIKQLKK